MKIKNLEQNAKAIIDKKVVTDTPRKKDLECVIDEIKSFLEDIFGETQEEIEKEFKEKYEEFTNGEKIADSNFDAIVKAYVYYLMLKEKISVNFPEERRKFFEEWREQDLCTGKDIFEVYEDFAKDFDLSKIISNSEQLSAEKETATEKEEKNEKEAEKKNLDPKEIFSKEIEERMQKKEIPKIEMLEQIKEQVFKAVKQGASVKDIAEAASKALGVDISRFVVSRFIKKHKMRRG